LVVSPGAVDGQ